MSASPAARRATTASSAPDSPLIGRGGSTALYRFAARSSRVWARSAGLTM